MMRILIVTSANNGEYAPFVVEQAEALQKCDCVVDFYGVRGRGLSGYLKNLPKLKEKIRAFHPDLIHAHYGLSGLLANLQRAVPVVTTYHGTDINDSRIFRFSKMALRLSVWNIFVAQGIMEKAKPTRNYSHVPCGVNLEFFQMYDRVAARQKMCLSQDKSYVLFAGSFDNPVKNASLAIKSVELLSNEFVELIELKGYSREEVNVLLCAVDVLLMTSHSEGSPQVVKEAMACGCPIVSVDVGDVRERLEGLEGCFVAQTREPQELAGLLDKALHFVGKTKGREKLMADGLNQEKVAQRLVEIYERALYEKNDLIKKNS